MRAPILPAMIMAVVTISGFLDAHLGWQMFKAALSLVNGDVTRLIWETYWLAPFYLYARLATPSML